MIAHEHHPAKVAALEGWWTTRTQQPMVLIGFPNEQAQRNDVALELPGLGSVVNNIGPDETVQGLDAFKPQDRPPVFITFWAFRIMVGMGVIMIALGLWGAVLWIMKRVDAARWFQRAAVLAAPSGFIAVISGWILAEVGRQPYVVYGVLRTTDAVPRQGGCRCVVSLKARRSPARRRRRCTNVCCVSRRSGSAVWWRWRLLRTRCVL